MHFTVGVFLKEGENLDKALIPYEEDALPEYLEFKSIEEECRNEYEIGTEERVIMPDGRLLRKWDEEFRKQGEIGFGTNTHEVPKELEIKEFPFKELYSSFEEFMLKWYGYEGRDDVKGKYGYWHNPDAKWDWYELGGRWRGMLLVKEDAPSSIGTPGVFGDNLSAKYTPKGYKWVDMAKVKDIEWELMIKLAKEEAEKRWDKVMANTANADGNKRTREYFLNDIRINDTKNSYVKRHSGFVTYAVLTSDGDWYEKDWGNEEKQKEWNKKYFDRFIKDADPELFLAIVDCHI